MEQETSRRAPASKTQPRIYSSRRSGIALAASIPEPTSQGWVCP